MSSIMTDEERFAELVADWQAMFNELNSFPLFERGLMRNDRLSDYEALREAEQIARKCKDDFIEAYRQRLG